MNTTEGGLSQRSQNNWSANVNKTKQKKNWQNDKSTVLNGEWLIVKNKNYLVLWCCEKTQIVTEPRSLIGPQIGEG